MSKITTMVLTALILALDLSAAAKENDNIDPQALIQRILAVEQEQRREISDIVLDAEYVEGEETDDGFKEKVRFTKKIYLKILEDTALFREDYLAYYKDGKLQKDEDRKKEEADRKDKKQKRRNMDISYSMLKPFYPENSDRYEIVYLGLSEEKVEGYICHQFRVTAREEEEGLINGEFYFEAGSFHLVRVDFSPAKLVKKTMFKFKELNMKLIYGPAPEGYWLPREFDIKGKAKAAFFFGVNISGRENYRNPVINGGIDDKLFEVNDDQ
ncbi:MAG: hypothetical protein ACOYVF_06970 [Candidatus Zixiibacteriota bacterium]